ncbi:MAG: hypothetical protein GVY13_13605 [Alphaproteobacteria bacterium]|jgi:hypothetical protein|nr:hypothetical protein [Alphaproteobacteria bacterium]
MPILKNAEKAVIPIAKIRDYVLNEQHPVGGQKARVFLAATGLRREDFALLIAEIREGILHSEAEHYGDYEGSALFRVDMTVTGPAGEAIMRTGWIDEADNVPRLTTAYLLRR